MSNFQCLHCGMTNIDCGGDGYKTPREIALEKVLDEIEDMAIEAIVLNENADELLEWIVEKIKEVKE